MAEWVRALDWRPDGPGPLPDKGPSPHPSMSNITISTPGIQKLLANLKPHNATGPDCIPPTVLKELSHEISPILESIFNISLQTGQVPNDWKEANIAPIFKKGAKHSPSNYRHRLKTQTDNVNDGNEISLVSGIVGWQH